MFFVSCGLPKIDHDYFPTGTCILGFWGCNSISHWLSLTDRNCYELDKELQDRTSWNNWNVLAHHCLHWISSLGLSQWVDLVPCVTQELRYKMLCNTLSVILLPAVGRWLKLGIDTPRNSPSQSRFNPGSASENFRDLYRLEGHFRRISVNYRSQDVSDTFKSNSVSEDRWFIFTDDFPVFSREKHIPLPFRWFPCGLTVVLCQSSVPHRDFDHLRSAAGGLRAGELVFKTPVGWWLVGRSYHSMYWGLEYSKNGEPLNINQPGLHGMKEDDRGILNSSYDSIMFNGESLGMWVCHHAINHPWLGMFFWHLSVVMWGLVYEIVFTHKRRITPNN